MFKLFSGTANPKLSQEVAGLLKIPLAEAEVVRFANSEVRVRIIDKVKNQTCIVIQPTSNPTDANLMELFLFCDSLRRLEAQKVIGIIPYFGYARQDIQHRMGECVSANVVIRFIESIGFYKIYTVDLHDEATEGVFSIPFRNISVLRLLADRMKKYVGANFNSPEHITIVSPDQGGIERARKFGEYFFNTSDFPMAVIEKKRDLVNIHQSHPLDLYGNVKGKTAILVDDMVISGSTLIPAIKLCLDHGARNVLAAIAHHDFSEKAPKIIQESPLEKFFTTNTICLKKEYIFPKLEEISIAPLIAEELKSFI
jgi:ribose-phosphate pyrophosphokinase